MVTVVAWALHVPIYPVFLLYHRMLAQSAAEFDESLADLRESWEATHPRVLTA